MYTHALKRGTFGVGSLIDGLTTGAKIVRDDIMAKRIGGGPRLARPPDSNEILKRIHKEGRQAWLQPKSGDLLRDVVYLHGDTAAVKNRILAKDCAYQYMDFLSCEFSELNLSIRMIRPLWHLEDDLQDA
jgi:hypothetical protein